MMRAKVLQVMKVLALLLTVSVVSARIKRDGAGAQRTNPNQNSNPDSNQVSHSSSSSSSTATSDSEEVLVIEFENLGFAGTYNQVEKFSDLYSDECSCEVSSDKVTFSGTNAPLNEELSVHFRGPLVLNRFAYYVSDNYEYNNNDSSSWERLAYYDASLQTRENVTFLTKAGRNSSCLGKALTYADSDGVSEADGSTTLAEDTLIDSNEEYVIMSNVSCGSSKLSGDCGYYREGIPAFHGHYGTIKMFVFEFRMPQETKIKKGDVSNWNMPAIWLLHASIPRTSQYPTNTNCSCWSSGCGEFDIFEILNNTESTHLYSTIHDYQGTGYIETGLAAYGHMERDLNNTMVGGVAFDNSGNAIVWLSNLTFFNQTISASDVNSWINKAGNSVTDELKSVSNSITKNSLAPKTDNSYFTCFLVMLASLLIL